MVRSWGIAAVAGLLLACMLCLGLLAHFSDADTLHDERRQQEMVAGFTARTLGVRIETYQRVLQSMGQGIHSSMLDTPYLLELLLREEAGYTGIFDSLVMTASDGSMVSYAPSGSRAAGGSALRDALRRTLADGKPQVIQMASEDGAAHLSLLLTVPLRHNTGAVRGALAGLVRIALHSLLPAQEAQDAGDAQARDPQFMLVDAEGNLLAHSQPGHALGRMEAQLGAHGMQWPSLASFTTSNADSRQWGPWLVTRVGLPLPRWQVVAVRDVSARMLGQRLRPWQWLGLVSTTVVVALLLLAVLWWLSRPLARLLWQGARHKALSPALSPLAGQAPADLPPPVPTPALQPLQDEATRIRAHWQVLEQQSHASQRNERSLESALGQVLEALPMGAVWARGDVLQQGSRRAAWLLGHEAKALAGMTLEQVLQGQPGARQWARLAAEAMTGFGQCRGELAWQMPAGGTRWLQVQGQQLLAPAQGSLWLLEDAQRLRQRRSQSQWLAAHDAHTGLPNRHTLAQQLQHWCARAGEDAPAQALLWVDVDYFTALNATAGRAAGDEVLRQVAWLLQREQGMHGMVARVGADAFVLWLRQAEVQALVQTLAWRLCDAAQAWTPRFGGRQRFVLGLSVGWLWTDAAGNDAQALLRAVEAACRDAKRDGQGRAVQARLQHLQP